MGITGTEVSKDAAAMILADDNFATIIKAVLNGRNVYRNIKNAILFLLSGNMAAIISVLFCSIAAIPTPFAPVQLLFINLLTDSLPALAIGMEASDETLLNDRPRDPKKGILTKAFCTRLFEYGILISTSVMCAFYLGLRTDAMTAGTMAFATLTLSRLLHGFNCRSEKPLVRLGVMSNRWSVGAFLLGTALLAAVLMIPAFAGLFEVAGLGTAQLMEIAGLSLLPTAVIQVVRMIKHR